MKLAPGVKTIFWGKFYLKALDPNFILLGVILYHAVLENLFFNTFRIKRLCFNVPAFLLKYISTEYTITKKPQGWRDNINIF